MRFLIGQCGIKFLLGAYTRAARCPVRFVPFRNGPNALRQSIIIPGFLWTIPRERFVKPVDIGKLPETIAEVLKRKG